MSNKLSLQVVFSALDKLSGPIRKMSGGSKSLGKNVAATKKAISDLNREQKKIDGLKSLRKGLQGNNQKLDETRRKMRALRMEIDQTSRPTKTMTNALKAAERQEKALTRTISDQSRKLNTQQSELKSSGIDVANLSRHERNLAKQLADSNRKLDQQSAKLAKVQKFQRRAGKISSMAGRGGAAMTAGITAPAALFAKNSFQVAMDAQEMESAFDVVFGKMAASTRKWAESTGNDMKRSTQEMMRGSMAFQELFGKALDPKKSVAMSKQFAILAQDLASFKNLSNDVAQQKLFSGLSGEAEPLRAVGVFLSEAKIQAAALALGLKSVKGKLTEEQKIVARSKVIMDELSKANGDVMRTSGSAANQLKAMGGAVEELEVSVGTKLLTKLTPLIEKLNGLLDRFNALSPETQNFILIAVGLLAVVGPLLLGIAGLAAAFSFLAGAAAVLASPFVLVGLLIAAAVAAIAYAAYQIYANWAKIKEAAASGRDFLWNILVGIKNKFLEIVNWIGGLVGRMATIGKNIITGLANGILAAPGAVWNALKSVVTGGIDKIKNFLGIKSPSRLFMALGGHMARGMELGITKGGKNAIRAAGRLAAGVAGAGALSMAPAAATPIQRAASSVAADTSASRSLIMYVTIKIDAEGKSAKELAKEIKKELEKLEGVSRRSDFEDGI